MSSICKESCRKKSSAQASIVIYHSLCQKPVKVRTTCRDPEPDIKWSLGKSVEEEEEGLKEQEKSRTLKENLQNQLTLDPWRLTETELASQSACMGRT